MLSMTVPAVTPVEATDYVEAVAAAVWPATETLQAQALMRGQRYVANRFNARWAIEFDADSVPVEVQYAIIEAAVVEARKPGSLNPTSTPATDKVLVQAGKLAWERAGGASGADGYVPRIASVEALLAGLLRTSGGATVDLLKG